MPGPVVIEKAQFVEYDGDSPKTATAIPVQFNPASLTVKMAGSKANTQGVVMLDRGATLSVDLIFDATRFPDGNRDVQQRARALFSLVLPEKGTDATGYKAPRVGFAWGTFLFVGTVTGFEEALQLFANDGTPLRSKVTISMARSDVHWTAAQSRPPKVTERTDTGESDEEDLSGLFGQ